MTDNNHPITPPPELMQQWAVEYWGNAGELLASSERYIATQAARWGADQQLQLDAEQINQAWQKAADQELKACCEWVYNSEYCEPHAVLHLRTARRPKPPSLKEQSLELIDLIQSSTKAWNIRDLDVVRRALEALPE